MAFEFAKWMFINMMVTLGLMFLATYPSLFEPLGGQARSRQTWWMSVAACSVSAVFAMLFPWQWAPGRQMDLRLTHIVLAGWFLGWPAAAAVGAVTLAVRFWIGGPGAIVFAAMLPFTVATSVYFQRLPRNLANLTICGLIQGVLFYAVNVLMVHPLPAGWAITSPAWLMIAAVGVLHFWLVNAAAALVAERHVLHVALGRALKSKETILGLIPIGVVILDSRRQVVGSNMAARLLTPDGALPGEILVHPEVDRALREGCGLGNCRVSCHTSAGDRIIVVSVVPMDGGAVLGLENVTSLVQEERMEAQRGRLELLGQLAAVAAHEIKNPLTTIRGFLQLLGRRAEFAEHHSTFALLQGEVEHINRVVGDFLTLAGTSSSQRPAEIQIDLVIADVLEITAIQHPDSTVQAVMEGEPQITLMADPKALHQVLRNLVANAYEAMPDGGVLTVRREAAGDQVQITVSDTGPGIPAETLPTIFSPYVTTKPTGTGLGLAISHKLAVDIGGSLSVSSEMGRGSAFRLTVRRDSPAQAAAAVAAGFQPER